MKNTSKVMMLSHKCKFTIGAVQPTFFSFAIIIWGHVFFSMNIRIYSTPSAALKKEVRSAD
jgi:hypothetical protein